MKQVIKPEPLAEAWLAEALYAKAIRYAEKMNACPTDSWDHALWSGLCLELLARAALANIAPVLLADPTGPNNLLHALGFPPIEPKISPKSVGTAIVLRRLRHLIPEFDTELEGFCVTHIGRRNAELHSGELPYDGVHGSRWHGQYFRSCKVLLASMGYDLTNLVGEENKGWTCAKYLLTYERTGIAGVGQTKSLLAHLKTVASEQIVNGRPLPGWRGGRSNARTARTTWCSVRSNSALSWAYGAPAAYRRVNWRRSTLAGSNGTRSTPSRPTAARTRGMETYSRRAVAASDRPWST